jgi:DNA-binding NarL/FixJ family response regulator
MKHALLGGVDDNAFHREQLLPDQSGLNVIRYARRQIMVVIVSTAERRLDAGAAGYMLNDFSAQEVCRSIAELLHEGSPITPVIARHLLKRFRDQGPVLTLAAENPALQAREIGVLQLIAMGLSVKVAALLALSSLTVSSHVKKIHRKLAANSRAEAIYEAGKMGLLIQ